MSVQQKVIQTATKEIGYKESGKNITKYANDFDTKYPTFYNTKKQSAEWCDIFYDWCFVQTFGENLARQMLYQPLKSAGAGCKFSANYYRQNNAFYSTPEIGDQIFFGTKGNENHTGIVVSISNSQIVTIEGNSANQVRKNYYDRTLGRIVGYGRPNWKLANQDYTPVEVKTVNVELKRLTKGMKDEQVKTIQMLLNGLGYKGKNNKVLTIDGDFGNNVEFAVKQFQGHKGLPQDGIVGILTWNKLLKG
jgi:hypothetical protein